MIRCRRCSSGHPLGVFAVGDQVVLKVASGRSDGLQPGTRGAVVSYAVHAGATHQEVHMQIKRGGAVIAVAPCELASVPAAGVTSMADYKALSREEFKDRLRQRRVTVRVVAST